MAGNIEGIIKFSFVAVCLVAALATYRVCRRKSDWFFLCCGLAATVAADYYLILRNNQLPGVMAFCLAHLAYTVRAESNWIPPQTVLRKTNLRLLAAAVCFALIFIKFGLFLSVCAVYALLFLQNVTATVFYFFKGKHSPLINRVLTLAGVLLFFACDICVLLYNLPRFTGFPQGVAQAAYGLLWIFYLPSQAVLAVSAVWWSYRRKGKGEEPRISQS